MNKFIELSRTRFGVRRLKALTLIAVAAALSSIGMVSISTVSVAGASGSHGRSTSLAASARPKIIYVSNGASSEPDFISIYKGFMNAGAQQGATTIWRGPSASVNFTPTQLVQELQAAIAAKPAGIVVSDAEPSAENPYIKKAIRLGIAVVISNAGFGEASVTGALTYVGNDEEASGELGGQMMSKYSKHVLFVTTADSVAPLVALRNKGFDKGFKGQITTLVIPATDLANPTAVEGQITIALTKDSTIDGVFSVGSLFNQSMLSAVQSLGTSGQSISMASIDVGSTDVIQALEAKAQYKFALDQQFYLQGYDPVQILVQYLKYGLVPVQANTDTGPVAITPQNASQFSALVAEGYQS